MSLYPGQQIGDYRVLAELGAGGMGKVYKVQNTISDRTEAMKILLPDLEHNSELAERFLREIKVQASLEHPHIARLHTALRAGNQLLMLMEFVEGRTVDSFLNGGRAIPAVNAVWFCIQVLSALEYAHARGIVHRDIKPSNMMLTEDGQIKLLDFGIARVVDDPSLTQTRQTVGSLFYMSPEQINGQPVDARSDLYSLGISLYQMVTGQRPFNGTSDFSIMAAHLQQQATPPIQLDPNLPRVLNDVIMTALAKDVNARFQSASAFRNAMERVLREWQTAPAETQIPQTAAPAGTVPAPGGRLRKLGFAALGTIILAGSGLGWLRWRQSDRPAIDKAAPIAVPATTTVASDPPAPAAPAVQSSFSEQTRDTGQVPVPKQPAATPPITPAPMTVGASAPRPQEVPDAVPSSEPAGPLVTQPAAPEDAPRPRIDPAVLAELRTRRVRLVSRLEACRAAFTNLRDTLAAQGLKPRSELALMVQNISGALNEADASLKEGTPEEVRQHFDVAEQTLRRLEKFFNF